MVYQVIAKTGVTVTALALAQNKVSTWSTGDSTDNTTWSPLRKTSGDWSRSQQATSDWSQGHQAQASETEQTRKMHAETMQQMHMWK